MSNAGYEFDPATTTPITKTPTTTTGTTTGAPPTPVRAELRERDEPDTGYEEPDAPTRSFATNPAATAAHPGTRTRRRMGGRRMDRQPPGGRRRQARRQRRRHRRTRHRRRGGRRRSSCGASSVTRCPTARKRRPPVALRAKSPSPWSPTPASPTTLAALADEYNETAAPVGDRCVKVAVRARRFRRGGQRFRRRVAWRTR